MAGGASYITHARAVQIAGAAPYLFMLDSKGRIWRRDSRTYAQWELVKLPIVDEWSEEAKVNLEKDDAESES